MIDAQEMSLPTSEATSVKDGTDERNRNFLGLKSSTHRPRHGGGVSGGPYALDYCQHLLGTGDVASAMSELFDFLFHLRCALDVPSWKTLVDDIRKHPVIELVHRCTIPHRALHKPRGYPGDAVLIDHLYGCGEAAKVDHPGTLLGQIYSYLTYAPATRAVRYRRDRLAQLINSVEGRCTTIVSLAAGHLREIELTRRYSYAGLHGRFLAVDQDAESLAVISRDYPNCGITPITANVKNVVTRKITFTDIDLIYAAGLLDYLAKPFAQTLARILFESIKPGGRLLLANFLPNIRDSGFMEAVMDWWLVYRTEDEMRQLLGQIPITRLAQVDLYRDPDQQIVFLEVVKA